VNAQLLLFIIMVTVASFYNLGIVGNLGVIDNLGIIVITNASLTGYMFHVVAGAMRECRHVVLGR